MEKKQNLKKIINGLLFVVIAFLTFYFVFKGNNINDVIANIKLTNKWYILLGLLAMFGYILMESVNIRRILLTFNEKVGIISAFMYSLVGFFFSSITPSSTGGQPMQLYYMNKDRVQLSHGTLALLVQLLSFQAVTLILAIVGFIFNYDTLIYHIGSIKYLMFFGIGINVLIQAFLITMIFSHSTGEKLLGWIYKLLKRFHYKKAEAFNEKSKQQLSEYHECAMYIKKNRMLLLKTLVTTFIQLALYHAVPYFVYRSFGLSDVSVLKFISMEAVLYISVASLPLPGSMGVSEGSFVVMFKVFFPVSVLSSAMIISRGISFYLFIIISIILIGIYTLVWAKKNGNK